MKPKELLTKIKEEFNTSAKAGIYWVPIRHHSPSCAYALNQLLNEVKPKAILIEGPADCESLVESVQHSGTKPPVAFLIQRTIQDQIYTAYFPMCEYSPEYVSMAFAGRHDIPVSLIDLPYGMRDSAEAPDLQLRNLMSERYLAHSQYLKSIGDQLGCKDNDQTWDRLFEQRSIDELADWHCYFNDVLAYCALARQDYEDEVLEANGDLAREAFMLAHIAQAKKKYKNKIVVITGGFHTLALMQGLADATPSLGLKTSVKNDSEFWLIRYSFDQLDAINGYSAGMPSPNYYQNVWMALNRESPSYLKETATSSLVDIAHDNRRQNITHVISSAEIKAAAFQAEQLANLRGVSGPGRSEILESVLSCYVKESLERASNTLVDARRVLCGDQLGAIPDDVEQTPLVKNAWSIGLSLGLKFDSTYLKEIDLELYRKPKHRRISQYFHLLKWIGCSLAVWQSGPDFINGYQTSLVREKWRYSWNPHVETELITRLSEGGSLEAVAVSRLHRLEAEAVDNGRGRVASLASELIVQACLMGLHEHVGPMALNLERYIDLDDSLNSIVSCGYQLQSLSEGKAFLQVDRLDIDIEPLVQKCWRQSLYLLPYLSEMNDDNVVEMLPAIKQQRSFAKYLNFDLTHYWSIYRDFLDADSSMSPILKGAALAILLLDGVLSEKEYDVYLKVFLAQGQSTEIVVGSLKGLVFIAKESLWRTEELLSHLHAHLCSWSEDQFLKLLPSLRMLFTELAPIEIDKVAKSISRITGVEDHRVLTSETLQPCEKEMMQMKVINELLISDLESVEIKAWCDNE